MGMKFSKEIKIIFFIIKILFFICVKASTDNNESIFYSTTFIKTPYESRSGRNIDKEWSVENHKPLLLKKDHKTYFRKISELKHLKYLDVSYYKDSLDLFTINRLWPLLEVLILDNNKELKQSDFNIISCMKKLKKLSINRCSITDSMINE